MVPIFSFLFFFPSKFIKLIHFIFFSILSDPSRKVFDDDRLFEMSVQLEEFRGPTKKEPVLALSPTM